MRTGFRFLMALIFVSISTCAHAGQPRALAVDAKDRMAFASVEGHFSIFSDMANATLLAGTFGYAVRGGYRWSDWGVFGQFEQNMWLAPNQIEEQVVRGAFNIGVGAEYIYAGGLMSTSLAIGPSVLAFKTILDKPGTTGFFFHLRPAGFRWAVHEHLVLALDPLSFALVAPVLGGIPLIYTQYRTSFAIEGTF
jgi:hypothetical protein